MKDSKIWIAAAVLVATFVLGFLAGNSMDEDPKPSDSPADTYTDTYQAPDEPTWEERMLECVQGRQTFYNEDRNFSTAVCSDHLSQQD